MDTNKADIGSKILASLNSQPASKTDPASSSQPILAGKPGTVLKGVVESSRPLPQTTIKQLANQLNNTLSATQITGGQARADSSQSLSAAQHTLSLLQTTLSKRADLHHTEIKIGRHQQPLLTPIPLKAGQTIVLTLLKGGALNLDPKLNPTLTLQANSGRPNSLPTPLPPTTPLAEKPSTAPQPRPEASSAKPSPSELKLSEAQIKLITNTLKTVLPQQQTTHKILHNFQQIATVLKQHSDLLSVPPKTLTELSLLVTKLGNHAVSLNTNLPSGRIQHALTHSGMTLEAKLGQIKNLTDSKSDLTRQVNNTLNTDLKSTFLKTDQLSKSLPVSSGAQSSSPNLHNPLDALLKLLTATAQKALPASPELKAELTQKLLHAIQASAQSGIARIRSQQLQQLLQLESTGHEAGRLSPPISLELPLRLWDALFPANIQLFERWRYEEDDEKEKPEEKGRARKKYWTMFMEFELDQLGKMAAEVKVMEAGEDKENVTTRLWAEHPETRRKIQEKLGTLKVGFEDSGLVVNLMECSNNHPPNSKRVSISQSLIDITT